MTPDEPKPTLADMIRWVDNMSLPNSIERANISVLLHAIHSGQLVVVPREGTQCTPIRKVAASALQRVLAIYGIDGGGSIDFADAIIGAALNAAPSVALEGVGETKKNPASQ